jgi:acyl carrier protein
VSNQNPSSTVRAELAEIVGAVLDLPADAVNDETSSATVEAWDSFRHLTMILAVEDAFRVSFEEGQIADLASFAALLRAVERCRRP